MTVNISFFAGAGAQFFNNNGVILNGGLLYTYQAGTTTPATTYTSSSGLIANSNPIVLDSTGRVPNEIWLTSSQSYKFILKTSDGVQLGSWDNIPGVNDFSVLAGATGATLIGYKYPSISSVLRTVASKLSDIESVVDFGADPTGSTDSTTAINNALGAGNVVYIPQGTYRIDDTILIQDNKTLLLDGILHRMSTHSSSTRPVVKIKGNYASFKGNGLESVVKTDNNAPNGVVLWGSEDPTTEYVNNRFVNVSDLRIECRSDGTGTTLVSNTLSLQNSQFWLGGALYDGVFQNLHLFNGGKQVYLNPISNGNIFNNIFCWNTRGYSVYLDGVSGGIITDSSFCNIMIDGSQYSVTSYYGRYVNNCCFTNCGGEPGAGNWLDFDATCSSLNFAGWDNHSSVGTFSASGTLLSHGYFQATQYIQSPELLSYGGFLIIGDISGASLNRFTWNSTGITPYAGGGGINITPGLTPGSGTANTWHWFKGNNVGGSGQTLHNVAVDGQVASLSGYFPQTDNTAPVGGSSLRFTTIYAATGTINTSDANEKQQVEVLSDAEKQVAAEIKTLIRKFKFNDAVAKKGDGARIHVGVIAQDVKAAFEKFGLDANKYGMFCVDVYYEKDGKTIEPDEKGQYPADAVKHERQGVRYEELLAFVIAVI